ncbi:periplasmic heavy metal sensor [Sphingopyxis sp. XHP0097]|uniref:Periplasmic heavy metal sensor n=1 Tax=Sphingopyxis jiangsuensis TaxID=2871171 RepID=A0ABS7MAW4_9SPHN|nr:MULTISPECIES: periplasmic heavy metal sensor [Sphingopyxis]MBL0768111.1 periplasmic heavy metal sensor [Sphingopyxis lutea]MBY4636158.1 periplasmic heavy metal sensor [Sphingopyxis jiangsuensis]
MNLRRLLLVGAVAFAACFAGVFLGQRVADTPNPNETELHAVLHDRITLTAAQKARIDKIEADFAVRRHALEQEMRASNIRLAKAIEAEQGYGPRVTEAIDHTHDVMGTLQKETLEHLFEMRAVLNREQAQEFDESVVKALTADAR